jgi:hypothetical protein
MRKVAIQRCQPLTRLSQADASRTISVSAGDRKAAIGQGQLDVRVHLTDIHPNAPGIWSYRNAVPHSVLHKGLQEECGNRGSQQVFLDVTFKMEAIAEPGPFHVEVQIDERQFVTQCGFRLVSTKRRSQQVGEPRDDGARGTWRDVNQRRCGVEGVEEKVWMQLLSEQGKLSSREIGSKC